MPGPGPQRFPPADSLRVDAHALADARADARVPRPPLELLKACRRLSAAPPGAPLGLNVGLQAWPAKLFQCPLSSSAQEN